MYDAAGRKLSIAEREANAAEELSIADAAHHWVVIERDKLRMENTELRQQLKHERKTGFADGQLNAEIKFAGVREAAQALLTALEKKQYLSVPPEAWPDIAPAANALYKALGDNE
jgi:hypothetical protein